MAAIPWSFPIEQMSSLRRHHLNFRVLRSLWRRLRGTRERYGRYGAGQRRERQHNKQLVAMRHAGGAQPVAGVLVAAMWIEVNVATWGHVLAAQMLHWRNRIRLLAGADLSGTQRWARSMPWTPT